MPRKAIDERFHKYGRLTVLNRAGTKDGKALWFCRCECGNFVIVSGGCLRKGNTRSCGCLQKETRSQIGRLPKGEASFNQALRRLKHSAERRNLEWILSKEEVKNLITEPCYYCGAKPRIHNDSNHKSCNGNFPYTGIDRIDSSKGYTLENVVSCCSDCNYMKHTLSTDEFKKHIIKIYNYLNLQTENKEES